MRYRTLGRTGIQVSPYAIDAMMFGAMGNPDHDDSIRIIHKALDAGLNLIDTADLTALPGLRQKSTGEGQSLPDARGSETRLMDLQRQQAGVVLGVSRAECPQHGGDHLLRICAAAGRSDERCQALVQ